MKKKLVTMAACISISCSALAGVGNMENGCEEINYENFQTFLTEKKNRLIKNPFDGKQCIPLSYQEKDTGELGINDFEGSKGIYQAYQSFLNSDKMAVNMFFDREKNMLHTFFKFNIEDQDAKRVDWRKQRKLMAHFDEFMFLHEIMHLDAEITRGDYQRNEKEAVSDIAAVLLISSKHDLSADYAIKLMKDVYKARKNEAKRDFAGPGRNGKENKDHFNKAIYKDAISLLEDLKERKINIKFNDFYSTRNVALAIVEKKDTEGIFIN